MGQINALKHPISSCANISNTIVFCISRCQLIIILLLNQNQEISDTLLLGYA